MHCSVSVLCFWKRISALMGTLQCSLPPSPLSIPVAVSMTIVSSTGELGQWLLTNLFLKTILHCMVSAANVNLCWCQLGDRGHEVIPVLGVGWRKAPTLPSLASLALLFLWKALLVGSVHVCWTLNVTPLMWTNDSHFFPAEYCKKKKIKIPCWPLLPSKEQLQKCSTEQRPSENPSLGITEVTRRYSPQGKNRGFFC